MVYAKIVGSALLILGCILYSQSVYLDYKNYVRNLNQIYQILYLLKGEITYSRAPLSEVFQNMESLFHSPYQEWLSHLSEQLELRQADNFKKIWLSSINHDLITIHLKNNHLRLLVDYGQHLGKLDYQSEIGTMELILNQFQTEIQKEECGLKEKQKLCNYLGIMAGLFLVILLF